MRVKRPASLANLFLGYLDTEPHMCSEQAMTKSKASQNLKFWCPLLKYCLGTENYDSQPRCITHKGMEPILTEDWQFENAAQQKRI